MSEYLTFDIYTYTPQTIADVDNADDMLLVNIHTLAES